MTFSRLIKIEGIIIKRRNCREADRIITLFTKEHGKIRCVAKGVRKISSKRAPHIELFRHAKITLYKPYNRLPIVSEAYSEYGLVEEKSTLLQISYAYLFCELIDQMLPEGQIHEDVFILLYKAFRDIRIEKEPMMLGEIAHRFATQLIQILGFLPKDAAISKNKIRPFIERIIERKLRSLALLTRVV